MTEPAEPIERRRTADAALANSSPDTNSLFVRLVELLLPNSTYGVWLAFVLIFIWVVAVVGVPALLAGQVFVDKWMQAKSAEREFELSLTKAKTLDAGGEILTSIKAVAGKLDAQGGQIAAQGAKLDAQGQKLDQLADDVQGLKSAQAATDKRVAGVAAEQGRLKRQISQPAPEP